jgi:hypothetical protein
MSDPKIIARHNAESKLSNDIHGTMAPSEASDRALDLPIEPPQPLVPPHEILRRADAALDAARFDHRQSKQVLADARQRVSDTLAAYNAVAPALTPEQNVRSWIANNQAERARRAAERSLPYRPSVTQTARAMSGGGHGNDIRARRGGGAAYRRGPGGAPAFSKSQATEANAVRARESRAKLPSEK